MRFGGEWRVYSSAGDPGGSRTALLNTRRSVSAGGGPPLPRKTTSIAAEVGEGVCAVPISWKTNNARIAANQEIISRQHSHGSLNPTKHPPSLLHTRTIGCPESAAG